MAIVTISRGSNRQGTETAEDVTVKLGRSCPAREAIFEAFKE